MSNLLPCPFCGGEAETDSYGGSAGTFDQCSQCFARVSGDGWNRRVSSWQSIDNAPKDGTRVLTCYRGADYQINHFNDPSRVASGHGLGSKGWWCSAPHQQPTHWQPLPSAPLAHEQTK